ncbi:MAG TPA: sulfite exporter TauE/SafE family protein [Holophagaceae bacterium]|nr:sulfite exporter TauE/SafE family protein [Holophagaceae bacterium]
MAVWMVWACAALSGMAAGGLSGMFGIGGGIVLVPVLGALLGMGQHQAQGISLATMLAPVGLPAVLHYRQAGHRIRWRLVGYLICGFVLGVTAGSLLANAIPARPLRWVFIGMLLLMALRYALAARDRSAREERPEPPHAHLIGFGLVAGAAGGLMSGLLGIGGGAVIIPLLAIWMGMPQHEAQVTSLALMLPPIGLPGVLVYAGGHGLPWVLLLFTGSGFAGGALLGARFATGMRGRALQAGFAGLLVLLALLLALRA